MITSYITIQDKLNLAILPSLQDQILDELEDGDTASSIISLDHDDLTIKLEHEEVESVKDAAACITHILLENEITSFEISVSNRLGEYD